MYRRTIASQFALVLASAALMPLVGFGLWSMTALNRATREAIVSGNLRWTTSEAAGIEQDAANAVHAVRLLAAEMSGVRGRVAQRRVLLEATARARAFRHIEIVDAGGYPVVDSLDINSHEDVAPMAAATRLTSSSVALVPVRLDGGGMLCVQVATPLATGAGGSETLVAEVWLDTVAQRVERLRPGTSGGALLFDPTGHAVASGAGVRTSDVSRDRVMTRRLHDATAPNWSESYTDDTDVPQLVTAARVPAFGWTLVIEQPAADAFSATSAVGGQLAMAAVAALLLMVTAGVVLGRRIVAPVVGLEQTTRSIAEGRFDVRAPLDGADEVAQLARSFNLMTDRLSLLQDRVKSQERQVMFGRVVAGLFHDLSHPIETIANSARLLVEPSLDQDERRAIGATVERERAALQRFLDDLLNAARPRPLDRVPVDVNASVADAIDALRAEADRAQVTLVARYAAGAPAIDGDRFALGRVCRNLVANAVQATGPGGRVVVTTTQSESDIEIEVTDSGIGIPPDRLTAVFDDFVTTKKRGLGLGLATSRRIVEQLGGSIRVSSDVGRGSTFTLRFLRHVERAAEEAR